MASCFPSDNHVDFEDIAGCGSALAAAAPDFEDMAGAAAATIDRASVHQAFIRSIVEHLVVANPSAYENSRALNATFMKLSRNTKTGPPSKKDVGRLYRNLMRTEPDAFPYKEQLAQILILKAVRSDSGILNISVSMPPDRFSCKYNCHFCPNEPGMPRSYLSNEDVFRRASSVEFDTARQVWGRLDVLQENGHPIDKLEFRVLGGTFSCYDHSIADEFVRDLYFAANTYFSGDEERRRARGTIEEEQHINVMARVHVVGLGIETRPDEINESEIIRFRRYGVTRVETGVQHTDDNLLRKVNRGHLTKHSRAAIRLLKNYGFKVEMHIMTDLPGATPEGDKECYRQVLQADPDLVPDYLKDYPCLDVSFTKIKEWKAEGRWKPYAELTPDARALKDVLIYRQAITPQWVRVNRIQRDFLPAIEKNGFLGYTSDAHRSNLAQLVKDEAEAQGIYCKCIRCCEVRSEKFDAPEVHIKVQRFIASGAVEYFLSAEVDRPNRPLLLGFCRLRFGDALKESIIPELRGSTAMIRELHVYGRVREVGYSSDGKPTAQHLGLGKKLLAVAEQLAERAGYEKMAIISGIGVRDYYRQRGYALRGSYMMKELSNGTGYYQFAIRMIIVVLFAYFVALLTRTVRF